MNISISCKINWKHFLTINFMYYTEIGHCFLISRLAISLSKITGLNLNSAEMAATLKVKKSHIKHLTATM